MRWPVGSAPNYGPGDLWGEDRDSRRWLYEDIPECPECGYELNMNLGECTNCGFVIKGDY